MTRSVGKTATNVEGEPLAALEWLRRAIPALLAALGLFLGARLRGERPVAPVNSSLVPPRAKETATTLSLNS